MKQNIWTSYNENQLQELQGITDRYKSLSLIHLLYSMQYIESSSIEKLYTFTVTDKVMDELERVMGRLMEIYVNRRFKSLEILETLL